MRISAVANAEAAEKRATQATEDKENAVADAVADAAAAREDAKKATEAARVANQKAEAAEAAREDAVASFEAADAAYKKANKNIILIKDQLEEKNAEVKEITAKNEDLEGSLRENTYLLAESLTGIMDNSINDYDDLYFEFSDITLGGYNIKRDQAIMVINLIVFINNYTEPNNNKFIANHCNMLIIFSQKKEEYINLMLIAIGSMVTTFNCLIRCFKIMGGDDSSLNEMIDRCNSIIDKILNTGYGILPIGSSGETYDDYTIERRGEDDNNYNGLCHEMAQHPLFDIDMKLAAKCRLEETFTINDYVNIRNVRSIPGWRGREPNGPAEGALGDSAAASRPAAAAAAANIHIMKIDEVDPSGVEVPSEDDAALAKLADSTIDEYISIKGPEPELELEPEPQAGGGKYLANELLGKPNYALINHEKNLLKDMFKKEGDTKQDFALSIYYMLNKQLLNMIDRIKNMHKELKNFINLGNNLRQYILPRLTEIHGWQTIATEKVYSVKLLYFLLNGYSLRTLNESSDWLISSFTPERMAELTQVVENIKTTSEDQVSTQLQTLKDDCDSLAPDLAIFSIDKLQKNKDKLNKELIDKYNLKENKNDIYKKLYDILNTMKHDPSGKPPGEDERVELLPHGELATTEKGSDRAAEAIAAIKTEAESTQKRLTGTQPVAESEAKASKGGGRYIRKRTKKKQRKTYKKQRKTYKKQRKTKKKQRKTKKKNKFI